MEQGESILRPTNLTFDQRANIFDKTVAKVTKNYFDPKFNGVDWPEIASERRARILSLDDAEAFELAMHDLVRTLGTSHTGFCQFANYLRILAARRKLTANANTLFANGFGAEKRKRPNMPIKTNHLHSLLPIMVEIPNTKPCAAKWRSVV